MGVNIDGEYGFCSELKGINKIFRLTTTSSNKNSSLKVSSTKRSKGVTGQTYILNSSQKIHSKKSKTKTSKQHF